MRQIGMTIHEAIENRERCLAYLIGCGPQATHENVEAVKMSLEALLEKAERENPAPLTLEELLQMEGEPVWVKHWHGGEWIIVYWDYVERIAYTRKACLHKHEYGEKWIAYRNKPKEA